METESRFGGLFGTGLLVSLTRGDLGCWFDETTIKSSGVSVASMGRFHGYLRCAGQILVPLAENGDNY